MGLEEYLEKMEFKTEKSYIVLLFVFLMKLKQSRVAHLTLCNIEIAI